MAELINVIKGAMRDATPEERKQVHDYIHSISVDTGLNFYSLISRQDAIKRFCEFGTEAERRGKTLITMVDAKYAFIEVIESLPEAAPPDEYTIELKKIDERRSLVLWICPDGAKKYVVCSYYDETKPVASNGAGAITSRTCGTP